MQTVFILALVGLTSLLAYVVGLSLLGARPGSVRRAALRTLEIAGTAVIFLGLNLVLGLMVIFAIRAVGPAFVAVYLLDDTSLIAVSVIQGLAFDAWRRSTV